MATNSLYRKHRPQRFAELVGQEHVTSALRHALLSDSVGHAYLFSGPRGTGKTTTGRVFAKALNCLDLADDGEPCGKCVNCESFSAEGITFPDLFEIDAASSNKVDDVRDLIQRVSLGLGATSKKKVYLIDEVHMLTAGAGNALLKTLEEPPDHVVFVLATTDPAKVLPTVRSRTQHFDFTLLDPEQLGTLVRTNLEREGIAPDDDAIQLVVRKAAGSGRDALSLLDQALALGRGALDADVITAMLGSTDLERIAAILRAIAAEDPAGALVAAHEALAGGADIRRLADDLLRTLRDAFVHTASSGKVPYEGPPTDLAVLDELAASFTLAGLTRSIELLGETIADIRGQTVPDPRLLLEVAIVRLARRESRSSLDSLAERVERLEQRLEGSGTAPVAAPSAAEPVPSAPLSTSSPARAPRASLGAVRRAPKSAATPAPATVVDEPAPEPAFPDAENLDLDDVIIAWGAALAAMKPPTRASVQDAQPIAVEGGIITFGVANGPRADMLKKKFRDEAGGVKAALSAQLRAVPKFKIVTHDFDAPGALGGGNGGGNAPAPSDADASPIEYDIDPNELVDAPHADAPADAAARLLEAFPDSQIVEERPR